MKLFRRFTIILVANFLLFILLFVFLEGVFRIAGIPYKVKYIPNENSFARFDPELGWSYIPNTSTTHKTGEIIKPVHFDKNGARVASAGHQPDYSRPSIIFIGGSFTMGHGLSYEESFVGKLARLKGKQYQVINLGVQGYGSDQALLALKKYLPQFNAKIVVYTFIEDHIRRNGNYDRRMLIPTARFLGTKPQFALDSSNQLYLNKKPLLYEDYTNSFLLDFLKIRIGSLLGSFPYFPEELTKKIILEMKRYSNEHNARFLVLNWRWTENDYDELFKSLDVEVIDTMKDAPANWSDLILLGGIHPGIHASDHAVNLLIEYFR